MEILRFILRPSPIPASAGMIERGQHLPYIRFSGENWSPVQGIQKECLPTNDVYTIMGSLVSCGYGREHLLTIGETIGDPPLRLHSLGNRYLCQMNSFHIVYELHSIITMAIKRPAVAGATPMAQVLTGMCPVPP